MAEGAVNFVISADTASGVAAVNRMTDALTKMGNASDTAGQKHRSLAGDVFSGIAAWDMLKQASAFVFSTFKDGVEKSFALDAQLSRLAYSASASGASFNQLRDIALSIQNPLLDDAEKIGLVADMASKGFPTDKIQPFIEALGNIAAVAKPAGETVAQAMEQMSAAILKGRVTGADLQRMLPGLKAALADAGLKMTDLASGANQARAQQVALNEVLREGQAAAGGLADYLKRPQGAMEALTVIWHQGEEALGKGFVTAIAQLITVMNQATGSSHGFQKGMELVGYWVGTALVKSIEAAMLALATFRLGWALLKEAGIEAVIAINEQLSGLVQDAMKVTHALSGVVPGATDTYSMLVDAYSELTKSTSGANKALKDQQQEVLQLTVKAMGLYDNLKKLPPVMENIGKAGPGGVPGAGGGNLSAEQQKWADDVQKATERVEAYNQKASRDISDMWEKTYLDIKNAGIDEMVALEAQMRNTQDQMYRDKQAVLDSNEALDAAYAQVVLAGDKESLKNAEDNLNLAVSAHKDAMSKEGEDEKQLAAEEIQMRQMVLQQKIADFQAELAAHQAMQDAENATILRGYQDQAAELSNFGNAMEQTLGSLGGSWGDFGKVGNAAIQSMAKDWEDYKTGVVSGSVMIQNALGAVLGALSQLGGVAGSLGQMGGGIMNIAMGFASSNPMQIIGGITSAVVGLIGALKQLFAHDYKKDVQDLMQAWSGFSGIDADLQNKIAEDAKKMGDAGSAMFMHLSDIASQVGITQDNWDSYFQAVMYGFDAVNKGLMTTTELTKGLNAILPQMIEQAVQFGGVYLDQLQQIIEKAKEAGVSMKDIESALLSEVQKIAQEVLKSADDLNTSLGPILDALSSRIDDLFNKALNLPTGGTSGTPTGGMGAGSLGSVDQGKIAQLQSDAKAYAAMIMGDFNAMIQAGRSLGEALTAIGPNLQKIEDIVAKLGLTMKDVGLGWLAQMDAINKKYPDQIALINAVTSSLQSMNTLGIAPGAQGFAAMQHSAENAFKQMGIHGKASQAQLALIKPMLIALAQAALQYGYSLDPAVIALMKQAGLWDSIHNKPDATKVQKDGIAGLIDALNKPPDGLIPTLKKLIDMLANLNGQNIQYTVTQNNQTTGDTSNGTTNSGKHVYHGTQMATLSEPVTFTRNSVPIIVDEGETLMPRIENQRRGGHHGDTYVFNLPNERAIQSIIERKRRQGRGGFRMPEGTP